MCVNDLLAQGAEPLFFLDYFATGHLDVAAAKDIIAGIALGCRQAGCALVGGETAEMPGLYAGDDYDLAGFAVGAAERGHLLPTGDIRAGDVVLGINSTGLHSNGFSLARRIVADRGLSYGRPAPFDNTVSLGEALLAPTRIYVRGVLPLVKSGAIKALAHITGGGLVGNVPRVLPADAVAEIDAGGWPMPPIFSWLAREGNVAPQEMARTFNCGIGMVAVTAPENVIELFHTLGQQGETAQVIGSIRPRSGDEPQCRVNGLAF